MKRVDRFCEALLGAVEGRAAERCVRVVFYVTGFWLAAAVVAMAFGAH